MFIRLAWRHLPRAAIWQRRNAHHFMLRLQQQECDSALAFGKPTCLFWVLIVVFLQTVGTELAAMLFADLVERRQLVALALDELPLPEDDSHPWF